MSPLEVVDAAERWLGSIMEPLRKAKADMVSVERVSDSPPGESCRCIHQSFAAVAKAHGGKYLLNAPTTLESWAVRR
jgi:hypothetical protein